MDYRDAMVEAFNKEMALWKIALLDDGYEISRGSLLIECGVEDTSGPHFKYENFNKQRTRAAMGAAYSSAQNHFAELAKKISAEVPKNRIDWLALNKEMSG